MGWYDRITGSPPMQQMQQMPQVNQQNRMQNMLQALINPMAFVKQRFPDIPDDILNDPNRVGPYIQQKLGLSNQQVQQIAQQSNPFQQGGGRIW
jgi:hypothetical protein